MAEIHLWPEENEEQGDQLTVRMTVEKPRGERIPVWYRLPVEYQPALAVDSDPFVLATIFMAMRTKADLVVHGQVSPSLLFNLEEFQAVWVCWRPGRYHKIDILADKEHERTKPDTTAVVSGFSGGVDSSFTVYSHHRMALGRAQRDLQAAVFIHGFDIPLSKGESYKRAAVKAKTMLDSLGMEMIPMAINRKQLGDDWGDSHAAGLASCLSLLGGRFAAGLVASSYPYANLQFPWGGNPITDQFLSCDSFPIIHDGAGYTRFEKIREISNWPEAAQNLRVCIRGLRRDRNCCRCHKCVRVILYYRILGAGLPPAFEEDAGISTILRLTYPSKGIISVMEAVHATAKKAGIRAPWVVALKLSTLFNRLILKAKNIPALRRTWRRARRNPPSTVVRSRSDNS